MPREGLVSVITPFLNAETFIADAIESVLVQTYPSWELLLIDDGSTDGSTTIAKRYASRYPETIRYLQHEGHENRGMSASRNLGVQRATGEYIAFLDADDVYLPEKLERQVRLLVERPTAAMVYGPTQYWYSWTGRKEDLGRDKLRKLGVPAETLVEPPTLNRLFLTREAHTPGTCGVLLRKEAVEQVGGFNEEFRGMFEDQAFFHKICASAPVYVTGGSWDRYRQHQASHLQTQLRAGNYRRRAPNPSYRFFLEWLEAFFTRTGIEDPALRKALDHELKPYRSPIGYLLSVTVYRSRQVRDILARFLPCRPGG